MHRKKLFDSCSPLGAIETLYKCSNKERLQEIYYESPELPFGNHAHYRFDRESVTGVADYERCSGSEPEKKTFSPTIMDSG